MQDSLVILLRLTLVLSRQRQVQQKEQQTCLISYCTQLSYSLGCYLYCVACLSEHTYTNIVLNKRLSRNKREISIRQMPERDIVVYMQLWSHKKTLLGIQTIQFLWTVAKRIMRKQLIRIQMKHHVCNLQPFDELLQNEMLQSMSFFGTSSQ